MNEAVNALSRILTASGQTLATAESCTGGLVSAQLTDLPGSSAWYRGGVVAYSNGLKINLLGVPPALLEGHGAVSPEVAGAMAEGACRACQADWALSVTGIAGPGGGTLAKPVGLVYMAVAGPESTQVWRHQFTGSRDEVRRQAAAQILDHFLAVLRGSQAAN
ncbi:MAG: CinA family protein [Lentisphaerae bacterium]|jgi:PncC family amidohydrolase|nr:CinA family protein [Lentisphaerota bacterium]